MQDQLQTLAQMPELEKKSLVNRAILAASQHKPACQLPAETALSYLFLASSGTCMLTLTLAHSHETETCCTLIYLLNDCVKVWSLALGWLFLRQAVHLIYPLTTRVLGAPQMILQPVSSIFPYSTLP
ncbi:hypothetical protein, partial [Thiolapillus sp.]|uniref:hypothetical protein n=1 Tax=Thiolapillus sp. TaxID=2017437 RepID=UPI003AF9A1A3